ncbi:HAD family hydrolase [Candidatus Kaiserbacteria bacterium]|nr:HAD family hydrolase [Candidatus Kaiserbacteria bacterium]
MQRFVLFDFDGVIANSMALSFAVSKQFNPELDEKSYRQLFEGNVYRSFEKLRGPDNGHRDRYFAEFVPRLHNEVDLVRDMDDVIKTLSEEYTLAVVSSTPSQAIIDFLSRYQLREYFSDILGVDVHTSKVEKMRMIFEKYGTAAEHCVFITDTLGDMREAEEHGMGAIGDSWGLHDHKTLSKGIPFRIVDKPAELPDAVADYFAA